MKTKLLPAVKMDKDNCHMWYTCAEDRAAHFTLVIGGPYPTFNDANMKLQFDWNFRVMEDGHKMRHGVQ